MSLNPAIGPTFVLAALLFIAGRVAHRRIPRGALLAGLLLAVPWFVGCIFYLHVLGDPVWFYELRSLPWSELSFAGIGWLVGVLHERLGPENWQQHLLLPVVMLVLVMAPLAKQLLNPIRLTRLSGHCDGVVCLQTSPSTCGPASAATILRSLGEQATERDLAREAYTSNSGTEAWYLARALRQRGYKAYFVSTQTELPHPAIAGVRMGGGHFIAVLSADQQQVTVMDPLTGTLTLAPEQMRQRYHFTGFFLVVERGFR
jgi:predicted double-glycine peptidase